MLVAVYSYSINSHHTQALTLFGLRQHNHALKSSLHTLLSIGSCVPAYNLISLTANALFT